MHKNAPDFKIKESYQNLEAGRIGYLVYFCITKMLITHGV